MLDEAWQDWIRDNLKRGCTVESMVSVMIHERIDPVLAMESIQRVAEGRAANGEPGDESDACHCWSPRFALSSSNRVDIEGHAIRIVARLERPAVAVLDGVLSDEECKAFITLSRNRMTQSTVVDPADGVARTIHSRSSKSMFFERGQTPLVSRVERRLAQLMGEPVAHGEGLQVLHYQQGGEYRPHYDYFPPGEAGSTRHVTQGGQRCATLIMYLNDVEAGGGTTFPDVGFTCLPRRGMGLYFAYRDAGGLLDPLTLHGGMPVARGEKWIMTKWVRERPYG